MSVPYQSVRAYEVDGVVTEVFDLQIARATLEAAGVVFIEEKLRGASVPLRKI